MNQKLLGGFTAALLISTFGLVPSGYADQSQLQSVDRQGERPSESGATTTQTSSASILTNLTNPFANAETQSSSSEVGTTAAELAPSPEEKVSSPADAPSQVSDPSAPATLPPTQPNQSPEVVKVGAYQSEASRVDVTVATIQPHELRGRQAATLYIRNIPVLTFLGAEASSAEPNGIEQPTNSTNGAQVKVASVQDAATSTEVPSPAEATNTTKPASNAAVSSQDPVWRATTTAARLNQLYRDNVNASDIKISWDGNRQRYVITANSTEIVAVDSDTVLPDTASNAAGDILQATNRIRRQMGNASPLSSIEGDPKGFSQVSLGPISLRVSGYASWYGPGFDGGYSASGEVFNQEAMTAAHPSLPFGTRVRVTNMDNGQSVVVRINDRGPYGGGRVIDLSAGAARVIGLIQAGVAPVSLEVLNRTASN